ncbi:MAG TPA: sigma-70 family RNA polymerase sigma factor [Polyangiaceae bacterium]|nr:sigma-70 family RNA polymerase sigma factor [Polyangiaceae bacterium]
MSGAASACDLRNVARRLRPFVERRVPRDDVDDVLQEVLEQVYEGVGSVEDETHYVAWLHRVARNAVADHHRRRGRADAKHAAFAGEWQGPEDERRYDEETLAYFVRAFVEMVPSPYHEALTRTELEGLTMREAAEREGVTLTAMKSRVQRGRRLLRELFEACCEIALDARGRVVDYEPRAPSRGLGAGVWLVGRRGLHSAPVPLA